MRPHRLSLPRQSKESLIREACELGGIGSASRRPSLLRQSSHSQSREASPPTKGSGWEQKRLSSTDGDASARESSPPHRHVNFGPKTPGRLRRRTLSKESVDPSRLETAGAQENLVAASPGAASSSAAPARQPNFNGILDAWRFREETPRGVLRPDSRWRLFWDWLIALLALASIVYAPPRPPAAPPPVVRSR